MMAWQTLIPTTKGEMVFSLPLQRIDAFIHPELDGATFTSTLSTMISGNPAYHLNLKQPAAHRQMPTRDRLLGHISHGWHANVVLHRWASSAEPGLRARGSVHHR